VLRIEYAYWLMAAFFALTAAINLRQRRWIPTAFWSVLAVLFATGDLILAAAKAGEHGPGQLAGLGVLALAGLAPRMKRQHLGERAETERAASAARLGGRLFPPALVIPLVTVLVVVLKNYVPGSIDWLIGDTSPTLVGLALACVLAGFTALAVTGAPAATPAFEGRRLLDTLGWAALLPGVEARMRAAFLHPDERSARDVAGAERERRVLVEDAVGGSDRDVRRDERRPAGGLRRVEGLHRGALQEIAARRPSKVA
jgi:uncharacterized membrane protein